MSDYKVVLDTNVIVTALRSRRGAGFELLEMLNSGGFKLCISVALVEVKIMSTISIRLPNYLHNSVRQLAEKEDVSINQFITLAVAEKISALMTEDFIEKKAQKGSRKKFEAVLSKVPNVEPEEFDRIIMKHP